MDLLRTPSGFRDNGMEFAYIGGIWGPGMCADGPAGVIASLQLFVRQVHEKIRKIV